MKVEDSLTTLMSHFNYRVRKLSAVIFEEFLIIYKAS